MRIYSALTVLAFVFLFTDCTKDSATSESALYGTWIKGNNFGDTLHFLRKNNHNIVRYSMSFNAGMPVYKEQEYTFQNGKLSIKLFAPSSGDDYPINSFTWTQRGSEFKIQGIELYSFMSSTLTYFTYRKI